MNILLYISPFIIPLYHTNEKKSYEMSVVGKKRIDFADMAGMNAQTLYFQAAAAQTQFHKISFAN